MKKDEFLIFRKLVIEFILMTDPKYHFTNFKKF